jgi:hypothetical protein
MTSGGIRSKTGKIPKKHIDAQYFSPKLASTARKAKRSEATLKVAETQFGTKAPSDAATTTRDGAKSTLGTSVSPMSGLAEVAAVSAIVPPTKDRQGRFFSGSIFVDALFTPVSHFAELWSWR